MKVMVTGGCGFLGSHICEFYANRGDRVVAFDNMTRYELGRVGYGADLARQHNWNYLRGIGIEMVKGDITDFDKLQEYAEGIDYLIHTAAQPAMTISIENPKLDFENNVKGTFNVLEVARNLRIPVAICSTIHVYGNSINETLGEQETRYTRNPPAISEDHSTLEGVLTPLHASKGAAELYLQTYIDTYELTAASFRLTGMYGPRQFGGEDHGWVANFCIRAFMQRPLRIFGTGKQVRDIIYPTDVAKAFHAFYQHGEPGVYNIGGGPECSISLLECIDLIAQILGRKPQIVMEPGRAGDLLYFVCDIGKAKKKLKWQPEISPETGIRKLLEWIQNEQSLFA